VAWILLGLRVMKNNLAARLSGSNVAQTSSVRVVLLENHQERAQLLSGVFAQEGLEVQTVGRDRDALQWLYQGLAPEPEAPPQLLLCNARMLGEGGLEVLARWCRRYPGVDVILLSAFESRKLRLRMARLPVRCVFDATSSLEDVQDVARDLAVSWDRAPYEAWG
jgi:CheY-like chemotaxis protein